MRASHIWGLGWKEAVCVLAFVAIPIAVLAKISPAVRDFFASEVTAAWASAIATTVAGVLAIFFSLAEKRQTANADMRRARLTSTEMGVRVMMSYRQAVLLKDLIKGLGEVETTYPQWEEIRMRARFVMLDISIEDVDRMTHLEGEVAESIQLAKASIFAMDRYLQYLEIRNEDGDPSEATHIAYLKHHVEVIINKLKKARKGCDAARLPG